MILLTQHERQTIIVLGVITLMGLVINFAYKINPQLKDYINLTEKNFIYLKVNINEASFDELVSVPYIGESTAQRIIDYRQEQSFQSLEELRQLKGMYLSNFEKMIKHLEVR